MFGVFLLLEHTLDDYLLDLFGFCELQDRDAAGLLFGFLSG